MIQVTVVSCGRTLAISAAILWLAGNPALAQQPSSPSAPMMAAMEKMNKEMSAAPMTGDTDHDFVAMMIPHHQGAIDMAKVELASGKDPMLLKLARSIVAAQEGEIKRMKQWQANHPSNP